MGRQVVLEAGCSMGRFTQIALETGAEVFSFDLSNAVEANLRNNGDADRVHIVQGSIYEIPLPKESFDKILCKGVLQHCPDVRGAFMNLVPFLRPGGEIVIDVCEKHTGLFPPLAISVFLGNFFFLQSIVFSSRLWLGFERTTSRRILRPTTSLDFVSRSGYLRCLLHNAVTFRQDTWVAKTPAGFSYTLY